MGLFDDPVELVDFVDDCYASALVGVLARLDYPDISGFLSLLILELLLYQFGPRCVEFSEPLVLWVFEASFDMECQWKIVEDVLSYFLVVLSHIVKKGLFVSQVEVVLQVVVHQRSHAVITVSVFLIHPIRHVYLGDGLILLFY